MQIEAYKHKMKHGPETITLVRNLKVIALISQRVGISSRAEFAAKSADIIADPSQLLIAAESILEGNGYPPTIIQEIGDDAAFLMVVDVMLDGAGTRFAEGSMIVGEDANAVDSKKKTNRRTKQ